MCSKIQKANKLIDKELLLCNSNANCCNANLRGSPRVCSLALRLGNTKVPMWTPYESIRYPKTEISHWNAAIHYGAKLTPNCDQTRYCNTSLQRFPPLPPNLRNNEVYVFTIAFSLPIIVIKPDLLTLFYRDRPLCAPLP